GPAGGRAGGGPT
ncbi:hypothetical protein CP061683_2666, partial [Chlamydia psittaci 06-1683]